jgi:hypothetical protein
MLDKNAYEFSRIFGQGWNAAKKLLADGRLADERGDVAAALNPYTTTAERVRWSEGFGQALSSRAKPLNTPALRAWRAAKQK